MRLRSLLLPLLVCVVASTATAAVILRENFAYPDGPLFSASKGAWSRQAGNPAISVVDRTAVLGGPAEKPGYLVRAFANKPAGTQVTAGVVLQFVGPLNGAGGKGSALVQFTDPSGKSRRGRVFARTHESGEGVELGIASRNSAKIQWSGRALPLNEDHSLVLNYESANGTTRLWINPTAASTTPDVESVDADVVVPGRIALQVDEWPLGLVKIRRFSVQDDPVRAAPASASPGSKDTAAPAASTPAQPQKTNSVALPPPEKFYVFLLIGQSNMAGRGVVEEIDRTPDPRILMLTADGRWQPAVEPMHRDKGTAGVGPGSGFARALLPQLPPGSVIGLIPAAFGGSRISAWRRAYDGPDRWQDGRTYFRLATDSAKLAKTQGKLAGILWNQGESDSGTARKDGGEAYRRQLDALISELREEIGMPTLPFIASTLGPWRGDNVTEIDAVFLSLPKRVLNTAAVNTRDPELQPRLHNKQEDPPHYDSASARALGAAYAETWLKQFGQK